MFHVFRISRKFRVILVSVTILLCMLGCDDNMILAASTSFVIYYEHYLRGGRTSSIL